MSPGGNLKIDVHEVTEGVAVTKYRVAQRQRHLEKTSDQKGPTTAKNKLITRSYQQMREQ